MRPAVAVFDVDGTLLKGDCLWLALRRSGPLSVQLLALLQVLPWALLWQLRLINTGRFKEEVIARFRLCTSVSRSADDWLAVLQEHLRPEALQRLRWHQRRGDRVLLCSASPRPLLQPLADWLGVELLCTELAYEQGQWLPRLISPNCKGKEKTRRLFTHLGPLDGWMLDAYGDSKGDRELLQAADRPHYRSFSTDPRPYPSFSLGPLIPIVALALLIYGLLGFWSQGDQLLPLLLRLWPEISFGLALVLLGYAIRYGRWRLLLRAVHQRPPMALDARIWMGSYAFTATPGKSGEAVRSLLLKQDCQVPMPPTLMALIVERITDGTAVLLLILLNLSLFLNWSLPLALPIGLGLGALALFGLAFRSTALRQVVRRMIPNRLLSAGSDGLLALRQLLTAPLLLQATLIGALAWSLEGVSLWLLLRGMGASAISIGGATIAHTAAGLIGALTLLPGGLGSTEAGTVGLLALQGISVPDATAGTLLIRLMTLWFATALGVLCLLLPALTPADLTAKAGNSGS